MRLVGNKGRKVFVAEAPPNDPLMDEQVRAQVRGHESDPGIKPPAPTRTTSQPFTETDQRKPYLPVEDTSVPGLDDGTSFRQGIARR